MVKFKKLEVKLEKEGERLGLYNGKKYYPSYIYVFYLDGERIDNIDGLESKPVYNSNTEEYEYTLKFRTKEVILPSGS